MTLIVQTTEHALVINAWIHAICMIPVARMPSVKLPPIVLYADVQVDGQGTHTQNATNVGVYKVRFLKSVILTKYSLTAHEK